MATPITVNNNTAVPDSSTNWTLDVGGGSSASRSALQNFLDKGRELAGQARYHTPGNADILDRQAEHLEQAFHNLERTIEKGGTPQKVTEQIEEAVKRMNSVQEALRAETARSNPLGITEHKILNPGYVAEFSLAVPRGQRLAYNYQRLTPDGAIATSCQPVVLDSYTTAISDPVVGVFLDRRPNPGDPSGQTELVVVRCAPGFKGYLTLDNGVQQTYLNVQNGQANRHLQQPSAPVEIDGAKLKDAAADVMRRPAATQNLLPERGTQLDAGGVIGFKDPGEIAFIFQEKGQTATKPLSIPKEPGVYDVHGFTVTRRREGWIEIAAPQNCPAGQLWFKSGKESSSYLSIDPAKSPLLPQETMPIDDTASRMSFNLPAKSRMEVLRLESDGFKAVLGMKEGERMNAGQGIAIARGAGNKGVLDVDLDAAPEGKYQVRLYSSPRQYRAFNLEVTKPSHALAP